MNLRDTGNEIGLACSRVLALSSATLVGSLIVSGAVVVTGEFTAFKAPHRVAKMSAILMGASAAGCILGAWMTGEIGKDERQRQREYLAKEWQQKDELARDSSEVEKSLSQKAIEERDKEIFELNLKLKYRTQDLEDWEDWWEMTQSLDAKYDVFGCKGCRFFDGSDDGGNFFVCAMHPYGNKKCEDRE